MSIKQLLRLYKQINDCPRLRIEAAGRSRFQASANVVYELDYLNEAGHALLKEFCHLALDYPEYISIDPALPGPPQRNEFPRRLMTIHLTLVPLTPPASA